MIENDLLDWKSFSGAMALVTADALWSTRQNEGQCPPQFPCIQTLLHDYIHVQSLSKKNSTCFINLVLAAVLEGLFITVRKLTTKLLAIMQATRIFLVIKQAEEI